MKKLILLLVLTTTLGLTVLADDGQVPIGGYTCNDGQVPIGGYQCCDPETDPDGCEAGNDAISIIDEIIVTLTTGTTIP